MSEELKACPFCGNHVEMVNTKTYPNFERSPAYMKCKTCNYCIAAFDDENLINRWNTRPIEDALQKRAEELEMNIKEAVKEIEANEKKYEQQYYAGETLNVHPIEYTEGLVSGYKSAWITLHSKGLIK